MGFGLKKLQRLQKLGSLSSSSNKVFDTDKLEESFVLFSSFNKNHAIVVKDKQYYPLKNDELKQMKEVLSFIGKDETPIPRFVDFAGKYDLFDYSNRLIFFSPRQFVNNDLLTKDDFFLNPLLGKIYVKGNKLLKNFSINEAVTGEVTIKSGDLDLKQIQLFPHRFKKGPFTLEVTLDTPRHTVAKYIEVNNVLSNIKSTPKSTILDPNLIPSLADKVIDLRSTIGALSRYDAPDTQKFKETTNSCMLKNENTTSYYLYIPQTDENFLIYFGKNPFENKIKPSFLQIKNGAEYNTILPYFVKIGLYKASETLLESRLFDLTNAYSTIYSQFAGSNDKDTTAISTLIRKLDEVKDYFSRFKGFEQQKAYVSSLDPSLIPFIVTPSTNDPVIDRLLPRLSWSKNIRDYHDTSSFIKRFNKGSDDERKSLLQDVKSNTLFLDRQNNDVNVWLYHNYKDYCENVGLTFDKLGTKK